MCPKPDTSATNRLPDGRHAKACRVVTSVQYPPACHLRLFVGRCNAFSRTAACTGVRLMLRQCSKQCHSVQAGLTDLLNLQNSQACWPPPDSLCLINAVLQDMPDRRTVKLQKPTAHRLRLDCFIRKGVGPSTSAAGLAAKGC